MLLTLPPPVHAPTVESLDQVLARLQDNGKEYDADFLRRVYDFSADKHKDQKRRSGEPYMTHPLAVSYLLADLKFDETCVAAGLLHDVLEDTLAEREAVEELAGADITEVVDGVTKISKHSYVRRDQAQAETFRKMILASARDIRVILVKLADRLHNMQTLMHMSTESRRRISRETLEIYAPLAHRLGMARVKGDLEDLAFYYLYPHQFAELHSKLQEKLKGGHDMIESVRERLAESLMGSTIGEVTISYRVKRYFSIYQKLRRQGIDISQLYDYLAFRIIVPRKVDTYTALGVVHQVWRPVPGRFKDYIAMPKPNLYQSLHTTLVGEEGQPFEVQIRTFDMDQIAEEGIAAHWSYKEGHETARDVESVTWLRHLVEWQTEVEDPRTFLTTLKLDLYPDEVYVFTPKGDVRSFPRGVTPLDFAYKIHTDVGHRCAGARVNGKLVPLRSTLQNGDIVEILVNPNRSPSRDWLNIVVTSRAKSKIRQWLNTEQKRRAMEIGRPMLEKELRRYKVSVRKALDSQRTRDYLVEEGLSSIDDLYSRIGFGKAQPKHVVPRLLTPEQLTQHAEEPGRVRQMVNKILPFGKGGNAVTVKGTGDMMFYLAKCCNPVPGEEIVGFITRGRGVSVHSSDCPNVRNLLYHPEREIDVEWARRQDTLYRVNLSIKTTDETGMLARLAETIAALESNITHLEAETDNGLGWIEVGVTVRDRKHLERILKGLRSIPGLQQVDRHMHGGGESSGKEKSGRRS